MMKYNPLRPKAHIGFVHQFCDVDGIICHTGKYRESNMWIGYAAVDNNRAGNICFSGTVAAVNILCRPCDDSLLFHCAFLLITLACFRSCCETLIPIFEIKCVIHRNQCINSLNKIIENWHSIFHTLRRNK